jgi:uroporphyrinogen-III synthase
MKSLAGKRVLVGRAAKQAGALSSLLRKQGATVIEIPFIEIKPPRSYRPLDSSIKSLGNYDWLILTSVNGVDVFFSRLARLKSANLSGLQVAAIGPATREAIERNGMRVSMMPREYVAESVVKSLRSKVPGKRVLLVRAKVARDVIPRELRKAGARVDVVEAYETVLPKGSAAKVRRPIPQVHAEILAAAWNRQLSAIRLTALRLSVNASPDLPEETTLRALNGS